MRRKEKNNLAVLVVSHSFYSWCNHLVSISHTHRPTQYLVLEHGSPKGPDRSKDKVELIKFLGTVRRGVFWSQQTLQQEAQHLDHALFRDGDDLLKPSQSHTHIISADASIFINLLNYGFALCNFEWTDLIEKIQFVLMKQKSILFIPRTRMTNESMNIYEAFWFCTVVHFLYLWPGNEDKLFLLSVSLLCFLFLSSAPIAVVMEVLEEASGPLQ